MPDDPSSGFGSAFARSQRPRRRPVLTRDAIVDAAVAILDREGTERLTIRRLAAELGAGAASIYWHVDDREALMDLALDRILDPEMLLGDVPSPSDADPTEALRGVAVACYELLMRHGWAAQHMVASRSLGPNLLVVWERMAALLLGRLTDEDVFQATSAVLSYVLGVAGRDAAWAANGEEDHDDRAAEAGAFLSGLAPDAFPALRRMGPIFTAHDQREQFLTGLDMLLAGIRRRAAATGP